MNKNLEPCPFCGSDNVAFTPDEDQQLEDTTTGFIWCHGCGFSSDSFYSEGIAAEHWNRRAATEANEALTCAGCTYQSDFPAHVKCHGCARAHVDHYCRPPEGGEG